VIASRHQSALAPTLIFTAMFVAVISSHGAPLHPSISHQLHVPLSRAQWSLTVTLLVGTISAPIMGPLGDGPRRRETMIGGLGAVTLDGVAAALAPHRGLLVVGRGLQGVGLGLVPLTMAAARDDLPRVRTHLTIAVPSVTTGAGAGFGYPISVLIADVFGRERCGTPCHGVDCTPVGYRRRVLLGLEALYFVGNRSTQIDAGSTTWSSIEIMAPGPRTAQRLTSKGWTGKLQRWKSSYSRTAISQKDSTPLAIKSLRPSQKPTSSYTLVTSHRV
jgi:MFS family permease